MQPTEFFALRDRRLEGERERSQMMLWFFMTFQADLYTMPFALEAQRDDEWAEPLFYPSITALATHTARGFITQALLWNTSRLWKAGSKEYMLTAENLDRTKELKRQEKRDSGYRIQSQPLLIQCHIINEGFI